MIWKNIQLRLRLGPQQNVSDMTLRGGKNDDPIRLVFRPELVDNPHDPKAAVRGTFVYQRKSKNDDWEFITATSLNTLKSGQGYKLELHAGEILELFKNLAELYRLHARDGIPYGTNEYVRADSVVAALMEIPRLELRQFLTANEVLGGQVLELRSLPYLAGEAQFRTKLTI